MVVFAPATVSTFWCRQRRARARGSTVPRGEARRCPRSCPPTVILLEAADNGKRYRQSLPAYPRPAPAACSGAADDLRRGDVAAVRGRQRQLAGAVDRGGHAAVCAENRLICAAYVALQSRCRRASAVAGRAEDHDAVDDELVGAARRVPATCRERSGSRRRAVRGGRQARDARGIDGLRLGIGRSAVWPALPVPATLAPIDTAVTVADLQGQVLPVAQCRRDERWCCRRVPGRSDRRARPAPG